MSQFPLFSLTHVSTLSVIALVLFMLLYGYKHGSERARTWIVHGLATCCLLCYPLHRLLAHLSQVHLSTEGSFPFHLCDLAAVLCGIALITRSTKLGETAYYWGLAATIQGLITPNISVHFPHPLYISFFWHHGFIVIAALFLPLALGLRPTRSSIWRTFGVSQLYALAAILLNTYLGTNYGYLASKPNSASLLDYLPDWPWYILAIECIALALFYLLQLPFSKKSEK